MGEKCVCDSVSIGRFKNGLSKSLNVLISVILRGAKFILPA